MKTFKQHLNEGYTSKYEKMPSDKLIKVLERTRKSIGNWRGRNPGGSMNSGQAQDLVDRYEEVREILLDSDDGKAAWKSYNKKIGASLEHDGYDLFA